MPSLQQAERTATGVGLLTTGIGAWLLLAPDQVGRLVGIEDDVGLGLVGLTDVVVAAGLLAGRPRWPFLAARAAANPPTAAYLAARGRGRRPLVVAAFLVAVTAADGLAARELRAAGR